MGNPEMRMSPPPIPDAAKKRVVPDVVKKESAEQVIPDMTDDAVLIDESGNGNEALKLSEETGKFLAEKEALISGPIAAQAEAAKKAQMVSGAKEQVVVAYKEAKPAKVVERDNLLMSVTAMEENIKNKFGVDVAAQSTKGLFGRIGSGFRNMMNGELRRAMAEHRAKLDELNKLSEEIDEESMSKEDWAKRRQRGFMRSLDRSIKSDDINVREK